MNSYGHRTVHSSSSPSLYVYFFSRQVLRPRRMGIVGALSDIFNIGCLEISAEYDPLLVIFGCIFLLKCIPSTIWLRFIARKLISSALKQCIWSKLIEICWLLSSEIQASGGTHIESTKEIFGCIIIASCLQPAHLYASHRTIFHWYQTSEIIMSCSKIRDLIYSDALK